MNNKSSEQLNDEQQHGFNKIAGLITMLVNALEITNQAVLTQNNSSSYDHSEVASAIEGSEVLLECISNDLKDYSKQ